MTTKERCPHENCGCPPHPDYAPHCGPYCRNDDEHKDDDGAAVGACACEHAACEASQETHPHGEQKETTTSLGRRS